jgi:hypothetical protein
MCRDGEFPKIFRPGMWGITWNRALVKSAPQKLKKKVKQLRWQLFFHGNNGSWLESGEKG